MTTINIPKHEHGVIRVFAISRPMAEMARLLKQNTKAMIASNLLGQEVTEDAIELFALSDLTGVGLPRYLTEGYDIDHDAVRVDHARLDALDGYVLLAFSKISNDGDVVLHPVSDLTLIGTYAEPIAEHTSVPIAAEAAKPYSGATPPSSDTHRTRVGSSLVAVAGLIALFLIWWIFR